MAWLAGGVLYSIFYILIGWALRDHAQALLWFRVCALLVPPMSGVVVIARRRHLWSGSYWLFWSTIALGLTMSAVGLVGWTVNELLVERETSWLGWHAVFGLFGGVAPLLALLSQPHRGAREEVTATTAVDIAGIAVMTGWLYSRFVVGPDLTPVTSLEPSLSLVFLSEFQQLLVFVGMATAAFVARGLAWAPVYRRLAIGLLVHFVILTISSVEIWRGFYRSGFVYDVMWIMPFAFYPWAAASAPVSTEVSTHVERFVISPGRPWVVFGALGLIPLGDFGLQHMFPIGPMEGFRDLITAITVFSVLPLLMARLAVERSEARQADSKRRLLAAATEQADDLIVIMNPDGRVVHANSAFCLALGYSLEEVVEATSYSFIAEQSRSQMAAINDAVRTDGVWRGTLVRSRKDGSTFLTSATVVSLADDSGQVTHFVGVERDVTQETQLREQLIHSERLAAVGQLVSGVAHEINNPLQSIVGVTELLIDGERREDARADLNQIRSEAHRAAKIVRNLLAFVRRSGAERSTLALNDIVRSTIALRRYELALVNVELEEKYAEDLPPVFVNREEIQQVLLNLLLNAEHALRSANSGGRLRVRTGVWETSVVVEIEDDGPGVPPALARKIFEPFFSTKGVGEGTGLGLSIGIGIATAHGGELTLVPSAAGACFRLRLPAASFTPQAEAPVPVASADVWSAVSGRRALVIDDEPTVRLWLQRVLTRRGFAVDTAEDGTVAMGLLEQSRYDVIFCDLQMPKIGGMSVYTTLQRSQPDLLTSFVFISGDILDSELQSLTESTSTVVLSKPFGEAKLEAALAQVLSRRVPRQPAALSSLALSSRVSRVQI